MKERKTFVYLLLACSWSRDLESQLSDWYYGDIIEAFIESEDQARRPEDLWAFGWEEFMARITRTTNARLGSTTLHHIYLC